MAENITTSNDEAQVEESKPRPSEHTGKYKGRTFVWIVALLLIISALAFALYLTGNPSSERTLLLATTTSTANSGLLDYILPEFEERYDCTVKVTPVGTGQALEMGRRGDVDVLMVHAPSKEEDFVREGYGTQRFAVCYNYFVIVGPTSDPADIKNANNVSDAVKIIFSSESTFVSRGDDSGTHTMEKALWEAAGYDYNSEIDIPENGWYYSVSAGMGNTLVRANELEAYTLTDEGTFYAYEGSLDLDVVLREDPNLLNQYSIIPVNPGKFTHVNFEAAWDFVEWITSESTQERIGDFEANGHNLFVPNADQDIADGGTGGDEFAAGSSSDETERVIGITLLTLYMAACSTTISSLIGIPVGTFLGLRKTKFSSLIKVFTHTLYGLPPVIAGLVIFILLSRAGPLGNLGILFTPTAMILAQVLLITPLIIGLTASAISAIPQMTIDSARTLGARRFSLLKTMLIESRIGIFTGIMIGFGRAISEVGAVIIVGGNIKWHTQVVTTAIVLETQRGNFDFALILGAILIALALVTSIVLTVLQGRFKTGKNGRVIFKLRNGG
ncbi:MAG: ABC transporter permease [Thermoplasmata archaeon]|nr:MAG: ABC transporter permease [Thermoplasmata archaeon]